jgi:hypothetical protein
MIAMTIAEDDFEHSLLAQGSNSASIAVPEFAFRTTSAASM